MDTNGRKLINSIRNIQGSPDKLALWSFGLALFSLFGYIPVIFVFAPVGAILYLFLHKTPTDILTMPTAIFLLILEVISLVAGLAAILLSILVLFKLRTGNKKGKAFAVSGALIGFLGFSYHIRYLFSK